MQYKNHTATRNTIESIASIAAGAIIARIFWEFCRADEYSWWNIDGYPTLVAAHLWLQNKGFAIYHPELWINGFGNKEWRHAITDLNIIPTSTSFVYHPLYLWIISPIIGKMTNDTFSVFWIGVNSISAGIIAAESTTIANIKTAREKLPYIFAIAISFPLLYASNLGQNTAPAFALIFIGNKIFANKQNISAAAALLIATSMKIWLLPLALFCAVTHGKRATLTTACILVMGLAVGPYLINRELIELYKDILNNLTTANIYAYNNLSLRSIISRAIDKNWVAQSHSWVPTKTIIEIKIIEKMIQLWLAITFAFIAWRTRPSKNELFACACAFSLLAPGICWSHYFVLLTPLSITLAASNNYIKKTFGIASLVFMATPWHNLHAAAIKWPTRTFVNQHEFLTQILIATPVALTIILIAISLLLPATKPALATPPKESLNNPRFSGELL